MSKLDEEKAAEVMIQNEVMNVDQNTEKQDNVKAFGEYSNGYKYSAKTIEHLEELMKQEKQKKASVGRSIPRRSATYGSQLESYGSVKKESPYEEPIPLPFEKNESKESIGTSNTAIGTSNIHTAEVHYLDGSKGYITGIDTGSKPKKQKEKYEIYDQKGNRMSFEDLCYLESLTTYVAVKQELPVNKDEELIVNIEELADELAEEGLKNKENTLKYHELLEKYKKLILKHERGKKE